MRFADTSRMRCTGTDYRAAPTGNQLADNGRQSCGETTRRIFLRIFWVRASDLAGHRELLVSGIGDPTRDCARLNVLSRRSFRTSGLQDQNCAPNEPASARSTRARSPLLEKP